MQKHAKYKKSNKEMQQPRIANKQMQKLRNASK